MHRAVQAKTEQIVAMSERELGNYQEVTAGIEERIKQTEEDIIAAKKDLDAAKGVRRNREEYDALAKVVQKTESRQETEATLAKINKEIADLTALNVAYVPPLFYFISSKQGKRLGASEREEGREARNVGSICFDSLYFFFYFYYYFLYEGFGFNTCAI